MKPKRKAHQGRVEFINIPDNVKEAIRKYCREKGIERVNYLSNDKRLKPYL